VPRRRILYVRRTATHHEEGLDSNSGILDSPDRLPVAADQRSTNHETSPRLQIFLHSQHAIAPRLPDTVAILPASTNASILNTVAHYPITLKTIVVSSLFTVTAQHRWHAQ
jgi:hypothetical protein